MTALAWDQAGERLYETGIDRGVLYLQDGTAAAWNGLRGVEEASDSESKSYYLDGVKYLESVTPGDFAGTLKAFTYPEEFEEILGIKTVVSGLRFHEQPPKSFNLSYRTKIGNDTDGNAHGYKIHLLYNLIAVPGSNSFESTDDSLSPVEFSWALSGRPPEVTGYRPTVHVSIDSTEASARLLSSIEDILYGSSTTEPRIPSPDELSAIFHEFDALLITEGAGIWTGSDLASSYITMLNPTTFEISEANIEWLDPYTYKISDTYIHNLTQDYLEKLTFKSPDGGIWVITVTVDGTFDITPGVIGETPPLTHVNMTAPDSGVWSITATNDGVLSIDPGTASLMDLDEISMNSTDAHVWVITVTNDGNIDIS